MITVPTDILTGLHARKAVEFRKQEITFSRSLPLPPVRNRADHCPSFWPDARDDNIARCAAGSQPCAAIAEGDSVAKTLAREAERFLAKEPGSNDRFSGCAHLSYRSPPPMAEWNVEIRASASAADCLTFKRGDWKQRLTAAISPNGLPPRRVAWHDFCLTTSSTNISRAVSNSPRGQN